MAAPQKGNALLADANSNPLLGVRQSNVSDPASIVTATLSAPNYANLAAAAGQAITITYATDDPSTSANGAIAITDGDATLVTGEIMAALDEFEASNNLLVTAVAELDADHDVQVTLNTELIADHATFLTEITNNRTAILAILDVLEEMGFMVAT